MWQTIKHKSFASDLCPCKALSRRIHHTLSKGGSTESYTCKYRVTSNYPFAKVTPTYFKTAIQLSVSALKLHHAGINPDLVGVHYLRAGESMSLKLHGASDTTIMKIGRWSSLTFLMYIHNQIGNISKGLTQTMVRTIPFLTFLPLKHKVVWFLFLCHIINHSILVFRPFLQAADSSLTYHAGKDLTHLPQREMKKWDPYNYWRLERVFKGIYPISKPPKDFAWGK